MFRLVHEKLHQAGVGYLIERPYKEVAGLIQEQMKAPSAQPLFEALAGMLARDGVSEADKASLLGASAEFAEFLRAGTSSPEARKQAHRQRSLNQRAIVAATAEPKAKAKK